MIPAGIEPATFRFVAQHLNHCATAVPQLLFVSKLKNPSCIFWTVQVVITGSLEGGRKMKLETDAVDVCSRLRSQYCLNLAPLPISSFRNYPSQLHASSLYLLIYSLKMAAWIVEAFRGVYKFNICIYIFVYIYSGFGGLGVACWPLVLKFAGSNPAEAVGFLGRKKSSARLPSEGK